MKKRRFDPFDLLYIIAAFAAANAWIYIKETRLLLVPAVLLFLCVNVFPGMWSFPAIPEKRYRLEYHGVKEIVVFLCAAFPSAGYQIFRIVKDWKTDKISILIGAVWCVLVLAVYFWNGILSLYLTSVQLGIRTRVIGFLCGLIFPVNLIVLIVIVGKCRNEVWFESEKYNLDLARKDDKICKTKYPILFVHGVFFRDSKLLNYWGRIPKELEKNGAVIFYGEHQSAASVENSAEELKERIRYIIEKTGCEKVNIIAHSKGGLDCRAAIANGAAPYVASLTTINTPHRGCEFADYLLEKVPENVQKKVENAYNSAASTLGDTFPDFMAAVKDLTKSRCEEFDRTHPVPEGIFVRSVGSRLKKAAGGRFPLNFSYLLVKAFDGPNDGLVGEKSFAFGDECTMLEPSGKRGISHGDMIDLNRENIPDFDVREFYVQLAADLKNRGL